MLGEPLDVIVGDELGNGLGTLLGTSVVLTGVFVAILSGVGILVGDVTSELGVSVV
jgi:hypothetical protein